MDQKSSTTKIDGDHPIPLDGEALRQIYENAPNGMAILTPDAVLVHANPALCDLVGYSADELLGRSIMEITHPDDIAPNEALDQRAIQGELAQFQMEKRYLHKDGRIIHVLLQVNLVRDSAGAPLYFIGQTMNITARKEAEEALQTQGLVLNSMIEGVNVATEDGTIIFTNPAFDRIFGYEPGELIGKHITILNANSPDENEQLIASIIDEMQKTGIWIGDFDNRRKDGTTFISRARIKTLEVGGKMHWVSVQEDITEHRRREDEISYRLVVEQTLAAISSLLVTEPNFGRAVTETLAKIGELMGAKSTALFQFQPNSYAIQEIHSWRAPDGPEPIQDIVTFSPWLLEKLLTNEYVLITEFGDLPPEAARTRARAEERAINSMISLPLTIEGRLRGVMVCVNFSKDGADTSEQLRVLRAIADLLCSLLHREEIVLSLEHRLIARTREVAAFFDLAVIASEPQDLVELLESAASRIMTVSQSDSLCIHLFAGDYSSMQLTVQQNLPDGEHQKLQEFPLHGQFKLWAQVPNDPLITFDLENANGVPTILRLDGYRSYLGAQIRVGGQPRGLLSCYRHLGEGFSLNEISLLVALAEQLGIMLENHRLRRLAQETAVLEERQRLARELHDSITQSLYSQTLFARAGRYALEDGKTEKLEDSLQQLETHGLHTLKEMRLLLFQLQPTSLENLGLAGAINERLDMVERRLGIQVVTDIGKNVVLSREIEEVFYRITLEALNNSLKHAGADEININLLVNQAENVLEIVDNGRGFETDDVQGGMGLNTMVKRVEKIGGRLEINTLPEAGTTVRVIVGQDHA